MRVLTLAQGEWRIEIVAEDGGLLDKGQELGVNGLLFSDTGSADNILQRWNDGLSETTLPPPTHTLYTHNQDTFF